MPPEAGAAPSPAPTRLDECGSVSRLGLRQNKAIERLEIRSNAAPLRQFQESVYGFAGKSARRFRPELRKNKDIEQLAVSVKR